MKRRLIQNLLNSYIPTDDEIAYKESTIRFIESYKECFERTLSIGHITASCLLIDKNEERALLTHHKKLNRWFQLGGHCDGDHDVLRVAVKEAQEESGILDIVPVKSEIFDIDVHLIPGNKKEIAHFHYDIRFILKVNSDENIKKSSESNELRWINKDCQSLPTENQSVVRLFNKWNSQ